jgi:hypothetical protein
LPPKKRTNWTIVSGFNPPHTPLPSLSFCLSSKSLDPPPPPLHSNSFAIKVGELMDPKNEFGSFFNETGRIFLPQRIHSIHGVRGDSEDSQVWKPFSSEET